jgi:hypothetical protein
MSELEYLESENIELKERIRELEDDREELRHSLSKTGSPLSKEEAKLLGEIHKCKIELKQQNLKKTGYNSHNKYSYFELGDFLPCLERILDKHGLGSYCYFENFKGYLIIFDVESGVLHSWDTPCKIPHVKENGFDIGVHMKAEQAVQTYARRTLYLQAFDIVEPNSIEQEGKSVKVRDVSHLNKVPKQKQPTLKKQVKQEPKEDATLDVVSTERVKEILDKAYATVTIDAGKEFNLGTALWTLERLCVNDEELRACKDALKLYTADKVKQ